MLIRIAALGAAAALLLSACTSTPAADASAAASAAASDAAANTPSGTSGATTGSGAVASACAAYFELDILNSKYAGGAVANGNLTEAQVHGDFTRLLKVMVKESKAASADGSSDPQLARTAARMKKLIDGLRKAQPLSSLSKAQQARFAKQSSRVENACARAGFPLPEDNTTARTAAGV